MMTYIIIFALAGAPNVPTIDLYGAHVMRPHVATFDSYRECQMFLVHLMIDKAAPVIWAQPGPCSWHQSDGVWPLTYNDLDGSSFTARR